MNGPAETYFGIKLSAALAGLIGGIVSLSFIRDLTPFRAVLAVLTGAATATYCTPLVVHYLGIGIDHEPSTAFFLGLIGMNLLAGIFKISDRFKNNPIETLRDIKNFEEHDHD